MAAEDDGLRDPSLLDPDRVEDEDRIYNETVAAMQAGGPPLHEQSPADIRAAQQRGEGLFGPVPRSTRAETLTIPGPAGELGVRVIRPDGAARGVYLHLHGGGWIIGSAQQQDPQLEQIADACGLVTFSLDYRLAPEHPYPAAVDDCEAAALWLAAHGEATFATARMAIGGESAGAHLAVLTLLRLRDRHGLAPFERASLTFGVYDLALTPSARQWGREYLVLSTDALEWMVGCFLQGDEPRTAPEVSPLYADLSRMPEALFSVGTRDLLLDDTLFCYARWLAAGSPARLALYPGGAHGFTAFPTRLAARANARVRTFLAGD